MILQPPKEVLEFLKQSELFINWNDQHQGAFLSHFFCLLDQYLKPKSGWDLGFFYPENNKIIIFTHQQEKNFLIKPEDDVFKKETSQVEELNLQNLKVTLSEAFEMAEKNFLLLFPKELKGDGFLVLQSLGGKTYWNFTFISKSLKFLNLKINAESKEIEHQVINVVRKDDLNLAKQ